MKYQIIKDDRYPDYGIEQDVMGVEIPDDKVKWIEKVEKEYDEVQDYLEKKYGEFIDLISQNR